jgi:hypothetical protein
MNEKGVLVIPKIFHGPSKIAKFSVNLAKSPNGYLKGTKNFTVFSKFEEKKKKKTPKILTHCRIQT